jgi:uncharacterized protein YbjT (DUF2867 family)
MATEDATRPLAIVILGATGAVGHHAALALAQSPAVRRLTLLGRRPADRISGKAVTQHGIDIFAPMSYQSLLPGHDAAVCTLGVGQPSKIDQAEFVRIDRDAVLDFARACRQAGVRHFELLGSVAADASSSNFYVRTKGQLEDGLKALNFERLSLFKPSMLITPTNRYGVSQGFLLAAMPLLDPLLIGALSKYRSVTVAQLGAAIAANVFSPRKAGVERLQWPEFVALAATRA